METLKGYKTVIFFVVYLLINLLGLVGFASWEPAPDQVMLVNSLVAIIAIVIRNYTNTPIFKGE